jgi:hypothetical protein
MSGIDLPTLPVQSIVLVTAFGKRSKRIRYQTLINFKIGEDPFESVFLISSQLANEAIIGCQLLKEYGVSLDFGRGIVSYVRGDELKEYPFPLREQVDAVKRGDTRETERSNHLFQSPGQRPRNLPADLVNKPEPVFSCSGTHPAPPGWQIRPRA